MGSTNSRRSGSNDVLGAQRPRVLHVPEYDSSAGDEAIELAALAGLYLDDWQQSVLRESMGERADGKWAAKTAALIVGRQNGKGSILEARELWGMFLGGERHIIHTAHLQKTATNHYERLLGLIRNVPAFAKRIAVAPRGKGSEAIILTDGTKIEFMTRARGNTRGLTVDLMVFDEAMYLSEQDRNAMVPTMAAQSMTGNTQTWYVGSAVDQQDPSQNGVPFAQVRESGIAGADNVALFEWSVPFDDPSRLPAEVAADPQMIRLANPGLGIRISLEWIEHERTVEMSARGYAVERMGCGDWPDTSGESGRVITSKAWAALAEHDESKRITANETFAIDTNMDQTWASVAVAGRRDDGRWQVHVVRHDRGKDWIVEFCEALRQERPGASFVVDPRGPASNLIPDLQDAGLTPFVEFTAQDYATACADFVAAAVEDTLRYPAPAPELTDAVADARQGPLGDRWKWSRKASTSADLSPLVSATVALWGARSEAGRAPEVWSIAESVARQLESAPPVASEPERTNFVRLEDAPLPRGGLFRP